MEVNDQNLTAVTQVLTQILGADNTVRKAAEAHLKSIETQKGFLILLLTLITRLTAVTTPQEAAIRQSAAVLFKNCVKKYWVPDDEEDAHLTVNAEDKTTIKHHVIELMSSCSQDVQKQLAEAVSLIAKHDFPAHWEGLLPNLVAKIASQDINIIKGVMLTANSIMKRFRYVFKSDALYSELAICLSGFQQPLLQCFQQNGLLIDHYAASKEHLLIVLETQRLMSRVFFSLNWQDIPEFFEDNIQLWMGEFAKYLEYTNPLVVDPDEEQEPSAIDKLQAAVLENINMYASKYEEEFEPYLGQFTQLVWKLLMQVGPKPKFDNVATNAIKFLTTVSSKQMNMKLFNDQVLSDLTQHIIVTNLTATEADEELFEDNPLDYIRKDMEGSDQDTRRRSACELVRSLLKHFNTQVSALCVAYINAMLDQYAVSKDWRSKDAALHLFLAVAVTTSSTLTGAGALNPNVDILRIFDSHVLPEIRDPDVNARPIVKADALKLVCIFRSHLPAAFLMGLMPDIVRGLHSEHVVIQTYAALCIERFLVTKDRDPATGVSKLRLTAVEILPFVQSMFTGLFGVLVNPDLPENDYVMKCVMRILVVIGSDVGAVTELVLSSLTNTLEKVCKNPVNPHYNHYLFESLALLVRSSCDNGGVPAETRVAACARCEELLFPPFQVVLSQDVVEFIPYVFQILAQLLCSRPGTGLSDSYRSLFTPLLAPVLWERKGNVPALTELFLAYLRKGSAEIVGSIQGILGVFQKLLASKSSEVYAFKLLDSIITYVDLSVLTPYLPMIVDLLLRRMLEHTKVSKTARYCKLFIHFCALFSYVHGSQVWYQLMEASTPGLVGNLIISIFVPNRAQCAASDPYEAKHFILGFTKILLETPVAQNPEQFGSLFKTVMSMMELEVATGTVVTGIENEEDDGHDDEAFDNREFDAVFSKLAFASVPSLDATSVVAIKLSTPQVQDGPSFFIKALSAFCQTRPGQYISIIQGSVEAKDMTVLQTLCTANGVTLQ